MEKKKQKIKSMPDVYRYSLDKLTKVVDNAISKGLPMIALFPYTDKKRKIFLERILMKII